MEQRKAALVRIALRAAGLLFGVIVLALIDDKLFISRDNFSDKVCFYDGKDAECELGLSCGALAMTIAIVFIVFDVLTELTGNLTRQRRSIIVASIVLSGVMAFLWIICSACLTRLWIEGMGSTLADELNLKKPGEATLAFCFFSIPVWIAVAVLGISSLRSSESPYTAKA